MNRAKEVVSGILGGLFFLALIGIGIVYVVFEDGPTCSNQTIPFQVKTLSDPTIDSGTTLMTTKGVNGTDKVCLRSDGTEASRDVVAAPVDELDSVGTYVAPAPVILPVILPAPQTGCPVTTCNDGWCSLSTGRGTCSHHNGVAY